MLRRIACMLFIAALAVVGIAMSSHSATPAGHSMPISAPAAHGHAAHDHAAPASEVSTAVDAPCPDCADDHSGILIACAFLALLIAVSILLPVGALRLGLRAPDATLIVEEPEREAPPRPPDLAKLCVSRQ